MRALPFAVLAVAACGPRWESHDGWKLCAPSIAVGRAPPSCQAMSMCANEAPLDATQRARLDGMRLAARCDTAPPSPPPPPSAVDAASDALAFRTVRNIEMVPYCLPYPSAYLKEDFSERWEHGRKVFTARATPNGRAPSRMDLAGTCGPRSLKELFEADRRDIATKVSSLSAITVSRLEPDSYALSWRIGDRIHYGKMWTSPGDPGCFVRATFDYDVRERAAFDAIIPKVTGSDPSCADVTPRPRP